VYQLALTELSRFLRHAAPRTETSNGHHAQRDPRVSASAAACPASPVVSVTIETAVRTVIDSDCTSAEPFAARSPILRD
jgi:putative (di)nucleoside polyphosphate hydrolase